MVVLVYSFMINLTLGLIITPILIKFLKKINYNQIVSEYSLQEFKDKAKTPSMGGIVFVLTPIISTVLLGQNVLSDLNLVIVILAFLGYGLIGFIDDYIIIVQGNNQGLKASHKLLGQFILSVVFFCLYYNNVDTSINLFLFDISIELGVMYAVLIFFMFTGSSNAVNITDGMDGLAGGTSLIALVPFLLYSLDYSNQNLSIFIIGVIGALVAYLAYNRYPASIFMGDTGALALGGLLAALAMVLKKEVALVIIGGVFVWEVLCVCIQIGSVKLRKGKKVFLFTPIHYSFTKSGYKEKTVVYGIYLLGIIFAIVGYILSVI